jgi:RimJ/RimL family protein N-acetyltransferase
MRLRDGTEVTLRPIRPDDKERMRAAFKALDAESVYRRVFSAKNDLSAEELRRLTAPDPANEVALVVTIGSGDGECIIAGGRFIASGDDSAELAFTVEKDYQGRGIATRLLRELAEIARARGIARFDAYVLPNNASMLGVFERSGLALTRKREEGLVRLTLELG